MKKSIAGLTVLGLICIACGGGNGGGDGDAFVSGVWRGAVTLTRNTCNLALTNNTLQFTHSVNQNESAVTLDDDAGVHYLGNVVGDDGFSVNAAAVAMNFPQNINCNLARQIEYEGISGERLDNNENTADVIMTFSGTCTQSAGLCEVDFAGTAVRGAGPQPSPTGTVTATATPTPGPTPVSGACSSVTERSYAGNLNCGFGNVAFDVTANGVTLEPLGVNGVTTFTSSVANASVLTSVRNDLTVQGVSGYSCTLSCAPPLEFFVKCTKEGATSCEEKF